MLGLSEVGRQRSVVQQHYLDGMKIERTELGHSAGWTEKEKVGHSTELAHGYPMLVPALRRNLDAQMVRHRHEDDCP